MTALAGELRLAVVEGDLATSLDAERIVAAGAPAVQINTGGGCHLEARMVSQARLRPRPDRYADHRERRQPRLPDRLGPGRRCQGSGRLPARGDDKPLKYPSAFPTAQAAILNKIDLAPYLPARVETLRENALRINPDLTIFPVSCTTGAGLAGWLDWLRAQAARCRAARAS